MDHKNMESRKWTVKPCNHSFETCFLFQVSNHASSVLHSLAWILLHFLQMSSQIRQVCRKIWKEKNESFKNMLDSHDEHSKNIILKIIQNVNCILRAAQRMQFTFCMIFYHFIASINTIQWRTHFRAELRQAFSHSDSHEMWIFELQMVRLVHIIFINKINH